MQQGDCYWNKPGRGTPSHYWVILSDPDISSTDVLIVNYTDAINISDDACELDTTDHPDVITKSTRVNYRLAQVTSVAMLGQGETSGVLTRKSPVPRATLDKILAGAAESDELKNANRLLLRNQRLIG